MRVVLYAACAAMVAGLSHLGANDGSPGPSLQRVHSLRRVEDVFAYARISPSGEHVAYTSQDLHQTSRMVKIIELGTGREVFSVPGLDAYWSPDGKQLVFMRGSPAAETVAILDVNNGAVRGDVAPVQWGDYPSWGRTAAGEDIILTIRGLYYSPTTKRRPTPLRVPACPAIGEAERPLLSRDATRITTFTQGVLTVRNLSNCDSILVTHLYGAKADFSADGRYIAYHAPRRGGGYEIQVADLQRKRYTTVSSTGGDYFPSWTNDGKLLFRQNLHDFRGFVLASNVLNGGWQAFPKTSRASLIGARWTNIFPAVAAPASDVTVITVWAPWNAHSDYALQSAQKAGAVFRQRQWDVTILAALEPSSLADDARRMLVAAQSHLPALPLLWADVQATYAHNQVPSNLLFKRGVLADVRLGALDSDDMLSWVDYHYRPPGAFVGLATTPR